MKKMITSIVAIVLGCCAMASHICGNEGALPVRGIHLIAPAPSQVDLLVKFINEACPKEGVNTLVLQIDYRFQYTSIPKMSTPGALDTKQLKTIAAACKQAGVRLIPQIGFLGHQSWADKNWRLLEQFPEFDETPGKYPGNAGIYCRSYCPLHPGVHKVMFALMDELCDASGADAFHAGLDEVLIIGDPDCPRCKGKDKADLFAGEVKAIRDHLAKKKRQLWIWGDRLIDNKVFGLDDKQTDKTGTFPAVDKMPKDIVICDWHYNSAPATAAYFAGKGFSVVSSPWNQTAVALSQLKMMREGRKDPVYGTRMLGMLQTTWVPPVQNFIKVYYGDEETRKKDRDAAASSDCFKKLFEAMRSE